MILLEHIPFETDSGIAKRCSIGLIVLATDYTIEYEFRLIMDKVQGVALYHSRIANEDTVTPETLRDMAARITNCARVLTPGTRIDVVAYGCTSASMAIGENKVFELIHEGKPDALCTTPITAAFQAFRALRAKRIGVLTPYISSVNRIVADYMESQGFEVPVFGSFNEGRDSVVSRITRDSVRSGIREMLRQTSVDAVFVSCTSVRLVEACHQLEEELGLSVTSSNHALAWHALRLCGVDDALNGLGSLYRL